jgi:hypothetical protein
VMEDREQLQLKSPADDVAVPPETEQPKRNRQTYKALKGLCAKLQEENEDMAVRLRLSEGTLKLSEAALERAEQRIDKLLDMK